MMAGLIPRLTVDDDLVASNDDLFQDFASVHRFVCGAVARTVWVVRTVVDDNVLTVGIELCQDSLFAMLLIRAIPSTVA